MARGAGAGASGSSSTSSSELLANAPPSVDDDDNAASDDDEEATSARSGAASGAAANATPLAPTARACERPPWRSDRMPCRAGGCDDDGEWPPPAALLFDAHK
jgi:hypothetical protein